MLRAFLQDFLPKEPDMKTILKLTPAAGALMLLAACGTTMDQRAATGAVGGAVAGQVLGGDTGSTVAGCGADGRAGDHASPSELTRPVI